MKTKYIALAVSLLIGISAFAQHNEEVTIEGAYRPKVNKVDKILMQPEKPQQSFQMPDAKANVLDIDHRFPLELEKLSALNYNGKDGQIPQPTKNFLMAGFGSRISPLFLYKHNSNLNKNLGLGVGVKHYSSWLDIKDYAPSSFMNNAFDINLTSKGNNLQLGGGVSYRYDMVHYYGFEPLSMGYNELTVAEMAPQQTYHTIGASFGLSSANTRNGEAVHDLGVDYQAFFSLLGEGAYEHQAGLDYDFGYVESWWGKKAFPQKLGVSLGVQYDNTEYIDHVVNNRLIFKVNPYFEMKDSFYRLHLGVRMDGATQFGPAIRLLTVHPDLKASLWVLDNALEFYAGLNGGRKMNTYSGLAGENPFVRPLLQMEITNVKLAFEGGIRTNLMNTVDVHVGVRYRHTDNDWFFQHRMAAPHNTWELPYNSFDVVYDETRAVSVLANVRWLAAGRLTVDAGFAYNRYTMTKEAYPWYRPGLEGNLKLNYVITEAFAMNASFLYQGNRWAKDNTNPQNPSIVKMKDVFDLGLGADWHVNEQLTVFAKLDNVLNQKYQLYHDYPVAGFQAFVGLKMGF